MDTSRRAGSEPLRDVKHRSYHAVIAGERIAVRRNAGDAAQLKMPLSDTRRRILS
jgi:hypothetical protein